MGDSQSTTSIHHYVETIRNYSLPPSKTDQLLSLSHLLKSAQQERINDKEIKLKGIIGDNYLIRSYENIDNLFTHYGCVEIIKGEEGKQWRVFQGIIKKAERNGYGVLYDKDQNIIYRGQFDHDLYEGWGCAPKYEGQFKRGKRHGWGIFKDSQNRICYQGYFYEDLFHGIGYINVKQNEIKQFLQQNLFLDDPQYNIRYVGEWRNGKMNGRGKLVTVSAIYTGDFVDGLFQGQGKLVTSSSKIEGKFYQGKEI